MTVSCKRLVVSVNWQVSDDGRGVFGITPMLTITRLHNSISAVGSMRRILTLAEEYANQRVAFGKYLRQHPLHAQTLSRMEVCTNC